MNTLIVIQLLFNFKNDQDRICPGYWNVPDNVVIGRSPKVMRSKKKKKHIGDIVWNDSCFALLTIGSTALWCTTKLSPYVTAKKITEEQSI